MKKQKEIRDLRIEPLSSEVELKLLEAANREIEVSNMEKEQFVFFWSGPFSQWDQTPFRDEKGLEFNCAEQYMMYHKAMTFEDREMASKIMSTTDPRKQKAYGREVKNYDDAIWAQRRYQIVVEGSILKYTQNEKAYRALLATGTKTIVEASPLDKIWGIGLTETNPDASDRSKWQGLNLLGKALMDVRERLTAKGGID